MISIASSLSLKKPASPKYFFYLFSFALCALLYALPSLADAPDYPVYVARVPNPNDYSLFANGGWDGNWYVGFNTCWMKKLPPVPAGNYARAYIGVKLGRMKVQSTGGKPWDKQPVPGAIYMAISSTPAWTRGQSYFVADTADIPLEGDPENALSGTGESEWFWAEVPIARVNVTGDNYLALWSPSPELVNISSSPVLAAAWGGKEMDTWLSRDSVRGAPPIEPKTPPGTGISYFQPAIALKLIPAGPAHPLTVRVIGWKSGTPDHLKPIITADVEGNSIESAWVEYFIDRPPKKDPHGTPAMNKTWAKVGRPLWKAPFIFSLEQTQLSPGKIQLRVAAANIWGEKSVSDPFTVDVSTIPAKK